MSTPNTFEGKVVTEWLQQGGAFRDMRLLEDFAYIDPSEKRWLAPAGSIINGASIPKFFWNTLGPPYVGRYRRASVVHDVACVEKTAPSEQVHRMFYDACLCDGLSKWTAMAMHKAIKDWGPSWTLGEAAFAPEGLLSATRTVTDVTAQELMEASQIAVDEFPDDSQFEAREARLDELLRAAAHGGRP